jgi:hypothetical protein
MKNAGCNAGIMAKPSGKNSTRMQPSQFARNNLAMGGVNKHEGSSMKSLPSKAHRPVQK